MRRIALSGIIFLTATLSASAADPLGEWRDEEGKATIRIVDCNSRIWGVIASEKTPGAIDRNNPDRTKQSRTTLGMPVLLNMAKAEDEKDKWEGEIYDPIRGKIFTSSIQVKSPTALRVEGCVAMILCGGQTWSRVEPGKSGLSYTLNAPAAAPGAPKSAAPFPVPKAATPAGAKAGANASIDPVCALPEVIAAQKAQ